MTPGEARLLAARLAGEPELVLLLDYDGTLVPFAPAPELARPDAALLGLLDTLTHTRHRVHIVSGRHREALGQWFGHLPLDIWAEHGLWHRAGAGDAWVSTADASTEWMPAAGEIVERFSAQTPGAFVEWKSGSVVWHYRMSDPGLGADRAAELRAALSEALHDRGVEVLGGHKIVEVRPRGIDKGSVVREVLSGGHPSAVILAIGDDYTDEDMFASLPPSGISVRVGDGESRAAHRLADWRAARSLLAALAEVASAAPAAEAGAD